jgi:hypothetical protein
MTTPVSGSAGYIALPVTTDADQLAADALGYLAQQQPGWVPREGHLEMWMIRAFARMCAETAQVASQVPLAIFQYFGTKLLGIAPLDGAPAQMTSTWTLTDSLGHTIPAGTVVAYRVSSSQIVLFETVADFPVPAGSAQTDPGAVLLRAVDVGAAANGLPAAALSLVSNLSFVAGVASASTTTGGADAEDQQAYLDRLAQELQLLTPRPILASDFAALARNQPGVARATALDGYNPNNGSFNNERMVTVACIDASGNPLPSDTKSAVAAALEAQREVNFLVYVVDPTYTTVNVSAQVVVEHGANGDAVSAAAAQALHDHLSPQNWGGPAPQWINTNVVRQLELAGVLAQVDGVRYVSGISMGTGSPSNVDTVTLAGAISLPRPGAITVTPQAS